MDEQPKHDDLKKKKRRFSIIPKDDPNQATRIRRFFSASAAYALNLGLSYAAYVWGMMDWQAIAGFLVLIPAINIILYIIFRTGLNLKFRDPSLTIIQMCAAILVTMYGMYFANEARGILLLVYILILIFGIYKLNTRSFLYISTFTLVTYGIDIALLNHFRSDSINLNVEYLQFLVLSLILVAFSVIGGHISSLRRNLRISRAELEKSLAIIKEMSIHDDLTGVYNRRHLMELLEHEHHRISRGGARFSVAMLDIDHFKSVNDTHGHLTGDEVLKAVSDVIRSSLRSADFCGRYGGEEFLLVMTQTNINGALLCAERIRSTIEQNRFPNMGVDFRVTVSLGVTEYTGKEDIPTMIARADKALYCAKESGRNRVESNNAA
ncbi:MAG: GGDEF domain-containing protein [Smithellaceae bacterium]|nr:GGDEF domain-containing protein [Smithellaceae bacterium]